MFHIYVLVIQIQNAEHRVNGTVGSISAGGAVGADIGQQQSQG